MEGNIKNNLLKKSLERTKRTSNYLINEKEGKHHKRKQMIKKTEKNINIIQVLE